jgi:hypothetical protein
MSSHRNNPGLSLNFIPLPSTLSVGKGAPDPLTRFGEEEDDAHETATQHGAPTRNATPVAPVAIALPSKANEVTTIREFHPERDQNRNRDPHTAK